jgi:hypothetical protein
MQRLVQQMTICRTLTPQKCLGPTRIMHTLVVGEKADQSSSNVSTVQIVDELFLGGQTSH